jgi:hypothetical protein
MVHDIDSTVELKNFSFTHSLSEHFLNRCGINSTPKAPTFGVSGIIAKLRIQVVIRLLRLRLRSG